MQLHYEVTLTFSDLGDLFIYDRLDFFLESTAHEIVLTPL
jgi:hypothetical protein